MDQQQDEEATGSGICEYTLWPEDTPPHHDIPCTNCELASQSQRLVWGEGQPQAPVWILLDNPGLRESPSGDPFVCPTRKTLQTLLITVGFDKEDLYVTYVVRRRPKRAYRKAIERKRCINNFYQQLETHRPRFIMCLGDVAVQSIKGSPEFSVKTCRQSPWNMGSTQVHASYHPLAVRRRPNLLEICLADWRLLHAAWTNDNTQRN